MTTKSPIRNVKTNLTITSSVDNNMPNEIKTSRISIKRSIKLNNLFNAKIKPTIPSNGHSTSPPLIFHAIAPVSPEDSPTQTKV